MTTVLLVEDDEYVRDAFRYAFEDAGLDVRTENDGTFINRPEALDGIDIVVTDIIMPNVEGIEVIMALRNTTPEIPVIAISGGGRISAKNYLDTVWSFGVKAIFSKPLNEQALIEKICELTSQPKPDPHFA